MGGAEARGVRCTTPRKGAMALTHMDPQVRAELESSLLINSVGGSDRRRKQGLPRGSP